MGHTSPDGSVGHTSPDPEGGITCISMLVGGQVVATELEVAVDAGMNGPEALGLSR